MKNYELNLFCGGNEISQNTPKPLKKFGDLTLLEIFLDFISLKKIQKLNLLIEEKHLDKFLKIKNEINNKMINLIIVKNNCSTLYKLSYSLKYLNRSNMQIFSYPDIFVDNLDFILSKANNEIKKKNNLHLITTTKNKFRFPSIDLNFYSKEIRSLTLHESVNHNTSPIFGGHYISSYNNIYKNINFYKNKGMLELDYFNYLGKKKILKSIDISDFYWQNLDSNRDFLNINNFIKNKIDK
jgi:NDP-sugar pyrophosphorylase family protein